MPSANNTKIDDALSQLLDAWVSYAIDPLRWQELILELNEHADQLANIDPSRFLGAFSKAEALSWRLRPELDAKPEGFAYLLIGSQDEVLAHSDDDALLATYIDLEPAGSTHTPKLAFTHEATGAQWDGLKNRVRPAHGHMLLELTAVDGKRKRYCYVVPADEFPRSLVALQIPAHCAILVPDTTSSVGLQRTLQSSFALTDAEVALTLGLVAGSTLKEVAAQQQVTVNTARNQLQAVFAKTGLSRQSELILVVAQLGIIVATATPGELPTGQQDIPERSFCSLTSGAQITYRCYGDPQGIPTLLLHETYGSSRLPSYMQQLAAQHELWLVVPDRPGTGFSTTPTNPSFGATAKTLVEFLDHFDSKRWVLCGNLTGGGYAMEMARLMGDRVLELVLIAGRTPTPEGLESTKGQWVADLRTHLVNHPWLLGSFFNILRNRSSESLMRSIMRRVYGSVPRDDKFLQDRPDALDHLVESAMEAQCVAATFVVADLRAYANGTDLDPQELECPVSLWHGEQDVVSPIGQLASYFGQRDVTWHRFPDTGSLLLLQEADRIFGSLQHGTSG